MKEDWRSGHKRSSCSCSLQCPLDDIVADGETCRGGDSYCFRGLCHSYEEQCVMLWGNGERSTYSDDQCVRIPAQEIHVGNARASPCKTGTFHTMRRVTDKGRSVERYDRLPKRKSI